MKALLQRVKEASVKIQGKEIAHIGNGILVFVGIGKSDQERDADYLSEKIVNLRIFDDDVGKMNLSGLEVGAEILVVSQFTLCGDCQKGRRPGFDEAMKPHEAKILYECFLKTVAGFGLNVKSGLFQEIMQVHLINDGPVTFLIESRNSD